MENITIDMENLSEEERERLIFLIEKSNKKSKNKRFIPDIGDIYYFIGNTGSIWRVAYQRDENDRSRILLNNYFKTREEAKFELEKRLIVAELERLSEEDGEIGPFDCTNLKYSFYFDYDEMKIACNSSFYLAGGLICFKNEKSLRQAIDKIGENRIKKYLFGVEEVE